MTLATGQLVLASDYNQIAYGSDDGVQDLSGANLGLIWSTGYGRYGYGQSMSIIPAVQVGDVITATQWNNLDTALTAIRRHQSGPGTYGSPGSVAAGQNITPRTYHPASITTAYANVGTCYGNADPAAHPSTYLLPWGHTTRALKVTQTLIFDSSDQARYYFNAGGKLKISFAHSGGPNARDYFWNKLCSDAGTIQIGYRNTTKIAGDGDTSKYSILNSDNGGFWNNSSSPLQHFLQYSPSGYSYGDYVGGLYSPPPGDDTLDYLKVEVSVTGSAGSNGGLGATVNVITTLMNGYVASPTLEDQIDGTTVISMVVSNADYPDINNSWGTPAFSQVFETV